MVAKKTAVQHSASGRSTGAATQGANGVEPEKAEKVAKTAAKKSTAKKATAKKTAAKTAAEKPVAKKAAPKKAAAKKVAAKKTAAKKAPPAEAASPAKKTAAKKSTAKKSTAKKTAATAADGAAQAAETTGATTVVAKKTPGTATAAKKPTAVPKARVAAAEPGELAVRPGEDPWTPEEVEEARAELQSEALRLGAEITSSEDALAGLMRDSGDGAGDDDADTGTKNITREHEMSLAANAREMLVQTERALERLDAGTYGVCENCGNPIGKARMQAFPRATLCVECKQKQERRS
ncbi:TraR/DksA family transcriptional regulator [Streptomyces sp. NPDC059037]|uniref:TraR/DksA family transcriptional regulator n=1 Tax=Streptomyces sp. NPDC059037 TaxID=3346710 RepID=UPI0036965020